MALEAATQEQHGRRLLREFDLPDLRRPSRGRKPSSASGSSSRSGGARRAAMRGLVEERARLVRTLAGGDAAPGQTRPAIARSAPRLCRRSARAARVLWKQLRERVVGMRARTHVEWAL